jgi:GNAT superfamily N-acetyltransferase
MLRELPGGFQLDDDVKRIDVDAVHAFISGESYWGKGRPREVVAAAIEGSMRVVGLYHSDRQIGFARAISDATIMAYLADVYVLAAYRGRGLGLEIVRHLTDATPLRNVRWMLHTADAQGLYEKLGFSEARVVYTLMERRGNGI